RFRFAHSPNNTPACVRGALAPKHFRRFRLFQKIFLPPRQTPIMKPDFTCIEQDKSSCKIRLPVGGFATRGPRHHWQSLEHSIHSSPNSPNASVFARSTSPAERSPQVTAYPTSACSHLPSSCKQPNSPRKPHRFH